jgi:hypothetical protein
LADFAFMRTRRAYQNNQVVRRPILPANGRQRLGKRRHHRRGVQDGCIGNGRVRGVIGSLDGKGFGPCPGGGSEWGILCGCGPVSGTLVRSDDFDAGNVAKSTIGGFFQPITAAHAAGD